MKVKLLVVFGRKCRNRNPRSTVLALCGCLMIVAIASQGARGAGQPSALALLRGAEMVRAKVETIQVDLSLESSSRGRNRKAECLVEVEGQRRRFEQRPREGRHGEVALVDGDEVHWLLREEHPTVRVFNLSERGVMAFDPRILGLSEMMNSKETIRRLLWCDTPKSCEIVGKEEVHGVSVWRVKVGGDSGEAEFWIEEPSFRVHRKTVQLSKAQVRVEIDSRFDPSDNAGPLPKFVYVKRVEPKRTIETKITVASLEMGKAIPGERFSLKSLDLRKNTPVSDERLHKLIGYWNGEGLSPLPIYEGEQPSPTAALLPRWGGDRWLLMVLGLLLLVLVVVFVVRRSRATKKRTA